VSTPSRAAHVAATETSTEAGARRLNGVDPADREPVSSPAARPDASRARSCRASVKWHQGQSANRRHTATALAR
jgi:hypothetical protein